MQVQSKKKAPLVLGIVAICTGWLSPIVGIVCGIIGLVFAISNQNASKESYKTEIILNIVGIVVAVLTFIFAMFVLLQNGLY